MKKQILALALCLAVSTSSAFAAKAVHPTAKPCAVAEKKAEHAKVKSSEDTKKCFEAKMAERMDALYVELGLTDEQKTKAKAIHEKTKTDMKALYKQFKADRKKVMEASKTSFESILTKEQKAKFEEMKKNHKLKVPCDCPKCQKGVSSNTPCDCPKCQKGVSSNTPCDCPKCQKSVSSSTPCDCPKCKKGMSPMGPMPMESCED